MPSITIVKAFTYRGASEEWSNTYHFSGTVPSTHANRVALAQAIGIAEQGLLPGTTVFKRAYFYDAGNEHSVDTVNFVAGDADPLGGSLATTGLVRAPGDVAMWVRWATPDRVNGKPIYLRKYFHDVLLVAGGGDAIAATQRTAAATYAGKMTDGTLPGGVKVAGPQGAVASSGLVATYATTRTLKRRGKRPPTAP
jgi:hypothetical protein